MFGASGAFMSLGGTWNGGTVVMYSMNDAPRQIIRQVDGKISVNGIATSTSTLLPDEPRHKWFAEANSQTSIGGPRFMLASFYTFFRGNVARKCAVFFNPRLVQLEGTTSM